MRDWLKGWNWRGLSVVLTISSQNDPRGGHIKRRERWIHEEGVDITVEGNEHCVQGDMWMLLVMDGYEAPGGISWEEAIRSCYKGRRSEFWVLLSDMTENRLLPMS